MTSIIRGNDNFDSSGGTPNAAAGAIGTYAFLQVKDAFESTARAAGSTLAGSSLGFTSSGNVHGVSPDGTWRLMGQMFVGTAGNANTSVWLRIQ